MMTKQNSKQTIPDTRPWDSLYDELQGESERAAAVIGGAMLDYSVSKLLLAFLIDDPSEVESLLEDHGPISSFNAKIRLAYCLGLITRNQREDLLVIAKIRNHFAHKLHDASFSNPEIVIACDKLRSYERFLASRSNTPPRKLFQTAIGVLIYAFSVQSIQPNSERRKELRPQSIRELLQQQIG